MMMASIELYRTLGAEVGLETGWREVGSLRLASSAERRAATNPTPKETGYLLDFHWAWLNHRPVLWTVLVAIVIVGSAYFAVVHRFKPAHMEAPEGEVLAAPV
jgi:hypothetical protein